MISTFKEILMTPPEYLSTDSQQAFQGVLRHAPSPLLFKLRSLLEIMRGQVIPKNYSVYSTLITSLLGSQDLFAGRTSPDILEPMTDNSVINPVKIISSNEIVDISTGTSIWALYLKRQLLDKNRIDQRQMLSGISLKFLIQKLINKLLFAGFQKIRQVRSKVEKIVKALECVKLKVLSKSFTQILKLENNGEIEKVKWGICLIDGKIKSFDRVKMGRKIALWHSKSMIECSYSSIGMDSHVNKDMQQEHDFSKMLDLNCLLKTEKIDLIVKMCMERAEVRYFYVKSSAFQKFENFKKPEEEKKIGKIQKNPKKNALRSGNTKGKNLYNAFKTVYFKSLKKSFQCWIMLIQSENFSASRVKQLNSFLQSLQKKSKAEVLKIILKYDFTLRLKLKTLKSLSNNMKKIVKFSVLAWKHHIELKALKNEKKSGVPSKLLLALSRATHRYFRSYVNAIFQHSHFLLRQGFIAFFHNFYNSELENANANWKWKISNADSKWFSKSKQMSTTSKHTLSLFTAVLNYSEKMQKFALFRFKKILKISKALKKLSISHKKSLKHVLMKWAFFVENSRTTSLDCYRYALKNIISIYYLNTVKSQSKHFHKFERLARPYAAKK